MIMMGQLQINNAELLCFAMIVLLLHIYITLITVAHQTTLQSPCSHFSSSQPPAASIQNPNFNVVLQYYPYNGNNNTQSMAVYTNSALTPMFQIPHHTMSCENYHVFTLNQSQSQFYDNTQYFLILSHISKPIEISLSTYFQIPVPTVSQTTCNPPGCTITLQNNCNDSTLNYYNSVFVNISTLDGTLITQFQYNFICDYYYYYTHLPVQWGILALVIFSIFMIFISSKFQQAKSYSNVSVYVNYQIIILYCIFSITKFLLIFFNVPHIVQVIQYSCIAGAVLAGSLSIMLCFSQIAYRTRVKCFTFGYFKGRFRIRVMDVVGFITGFGAMCGWYLSESNWIVSDVIFIFIYITVIKIAKFGSLKIALINFICTLILDLIFITVTEIVKKQYLTSNINIFNNPLFLIAPYIAYIPNYRCAWYFILSMAYPGMFLAYLERFDKNRSSTLYAPLFLICYALCSIAWFVVSCLVPFGLPYDLFTVPISMILLFLFANRRGELEDLWSGRFFDEQKSFYENEKELIENLKRQKSPSTITYEKQMFNTLRYDGLSRYSRDSSATSNFSEIVAAANIQLELKPVYSGRQKDEKVHRKQNQKKQGMHQSNQTQFVSQIQSNSISEVLRDGLIQKP